MPDSGRRCIPDTVVPKCPFSQPTVSHHLKTLVQAGLLHRQQRGTWAYYLLDRDALARLAAAATLQQAGTP
jgi:ArsR family transcriptional regulator, arsenate/arsenite/antimonite-responsive transcriptional repressor